MNIHPRFAYLFAVTVLLGSLVGCGAGDYKKRVDASAERLKSGSAFKSLGAPVALGDTGISARIPKIFGDPPQTCNDASRIEVPGLEKLLDKDTFGYETILPLDDNEATGKAAVSLRFWVRQSPRMLFSDAIQVWLQNTFPATSEKSKQVSLRTDRGEESSWLMAAGERKQTFLCSVGGQEVPQEHDARVAAYIYKTPDDSIQILMTLRAPKAVWERYNLKKLADQTAGCLAIKKVEVVQ